jgi:hypothetical protein
MRAIPNQRRVYSSEGPEQYNASPNRARNASKAGGFAVVIVE